ncbi:helix-turn-helix domain-containing protein [Streptomyces sp. NPDC054863]
MSAQPDGPVPFRRPATRTDLNPTAAGVVLGMELRNLRKAHKIPLVTAGKAISASVSKVSRLECAESPPDLRDVRELASFYRAGTAQIQHLEHLTKRALEPAWFDRYEDFSSSWTHRLIGLESAAVSLWTYEVNLMPGLLQSEEYAREIFSNDLGVNGNEQVEQRVALRHERQRRFFEQPDPPSAVFLLDESVLARSPGDSRIMRGQLNKLLGMLRIPNVSIRFVPLKRSVVTAVGSMTCLKFSAGGPQDMVYVETHDAASYYTKQAEVERYYQLMLRLSEEAAASRHKSHEMLLAAIADFTD